MSQDEGGPVPIDDGEIHEWLDGELNATRAAELEALTQASPEFARRVAEARGLIAASSRILGALDEVPAGVLPQLSTAATVVANHSNSVPVRAAHRWSLRRVSSIAALLMVGVTGVVVARREPALHEQVATSAPPLTGVPAPTQSMRSAPEAPLPSQALAATPPPAPVPVPVPMPVPMPAPAPAPVRSAEVVAEAKALPPPSAAVGERRSATPPTLGAARFSGATVLGAPAASSADAAGNAAIRSDVLPADLLFGVQRVQCAPGCVQVRTEVARDGHLRRWIQSLGKATVTDSSTLDANTLAELTQRMAALRLDTLPAVLQLDGSKCYSVGSLRESLRVSFVHNNAPRQVMGLPWCTDGSHVLDRAAQLIEEAAALKLGGVSRLVR